MQLNSQSLAPALAMTTRLLLAVFAGYAFSAAWVTLCGALLARLGIPRSEAVVLAAMLGFVVYLCLLLWAFSERRLWRIGAVTLGGTGLFWLLAAVLSPPASA